MEKVNEKTHTLCRVPLGRDNRRRWDKNEEDLGGAGAGAWKSVMPQRALIQTMVTQGFSSGVWEVAPAMFVQYQGKW